MCIQSEKSRSHESSRTPPKNFTSRKVVGDVYPSFCRETGALIPENSQVSFIFFMCIIICPLCFFSYNRQLTCVFVCIPVLETVIVTPEAVLKPQGMNRAHVSETAILLPT